MAANALPLDVIFNIISGLPIKTLCKFRCVSKSWSALISDPVFQQSRDELSSQSPDLVITEIGRTIDGHPKLNYFMFDRESRTQNFVTNLPETESLDLLTPARSCSDLLCAYSYRNIYIYNLAMKKLITLPDTSSHYMSMLPDKHQHPRLRQLVALGYVASTSDYKVLRVYTQGYRFNYYGRTIKCEVFTLGSKFWRAVKSPPNDINIDFCSSTDGAVYFISYGGSSVDGIKSVSVFDLCREEWSVFPIPDNVCIQGQGENASSFYLLQAGGQLCIAVGGSLRFVYCSYYLNPDIVLWILKDNGNGNWVWEKKCSIENCRSLPLAIEQDGKVLMRKSDVKFKLQYYDPKDGTFEEICAGKSRFTASFYAESFRSLNIRGFKNAPAPVLRKKRLDGGGEEE